MDEGLLRNTPVITLAWMVSSLHHNGNIHTKPTSELHDCYKDWEWYSPQAADEWLDQSLQPAEVSRQQPD